MKVLLDTVVGAELTVINQREKLLPCGACYVVGVEKQATEKYVCW